MIISNMQEEHDDLNRDYVLEKVKIYSEIRVSKVKLKNRANTRLNALCEMLEGVSEISGNYVEVVDFFVSLFDDVILECAICAGRREEVEEKIISLCTKALEQPTKDGTRNEKDEHVTATLIDCLSETPSADVSKKMAAALLDETNPLRLGLSFYENFCEKNPLYTDVNALDYFKMETTVRESLVKGTSEETIAHVEKMLASPINCAEKYLLTSLNFFSLGYREDAANALDVGLKHFPNNERLMGAKNSLPQ